MLYNRWLVGISISCNFWVQIWSCRFENGLQMLYHTALQGVSVPITLFKPGIVLKNKRGVVDLPLVLGFVITISLGEKN